MELNKDDYCNTNLKIIFKNGIPSYYKKGHFDRIAV